MTQGYLTFAQNNARTNYLNLAYLQALSIKVTNKINKYAVVVDDDTMSRIEDRHRRVFDHIIPIPGGDDAKGHSWKMQNEWKANIASPFDETIKLESDMLFTSCVDHWWKILDARDMVFTNHVVDYTGRSSTTRVYRQLFDDNSLPDIYGGLYYFKKSNTADLFFEYAKSIFANWTYTKHYILKGCGNETASTDVVFALAAKLVGADLCTLPGPVPTFAHMKGAVQGWEPSMVWSEHLMHQFDQHHLTVGAHRQQVPFHYHYKNFATPEVIKHYEQLYFGK